jgi:hypothetical protein
MLALPEELEQSFLEEVFRFEQERISVTAGENLPVPFADAASVPQRGQAHFRRLSLGS